jgi:protein TonB
MIRHRQLTVALCVAALVWTQARVARAGEGAPADTSRPAAPAGITLEGTKAGELVVVDEVPKPIVRVPPDYPEEARRNGVQGTVYVRAIVGRNGVPAKVGIPKGKGVAPGLDSAAVKAVRRWRFFPAKVKGEPVAVWIMLPVKFSLH